MDLSELSVFLKGPKIRQSLSFAIFCPKFLENLEKRVLTFWKSTCNPFNRFRNKRFTVPLYSSFLLLEPLGQKIKKKTVGSILAKTVDNFTST